MKKIFNIVLTAALALAFAACDDVDVDYGIPSKTPQEAIMPADGVAATSVVTNGGSVNLETATNGYVDILDVTKLENFPAGQDLKVVMNVSASSDMSNASSVDLNVIPGTEAGVVKVAQIPAQALDEIIKSNVTRDPTAQATLYVNFVAYAVNGGSTVLLGSVGQQQSIVVTPLSYEHPVETTYYIYGTINDGSVANAVQLNHEGNQYDNPVFKLKVDITPEQVAAGGWKFKVIPQSTKDTGKDWADNKDGVYIGAGAGEGTLAYATDTEDCDWIVIDKSGELMINVNVLDQTWEISNAFSYVYVPGVGNGWSFSTQLGTNNYINYTGYAYLVDEFKFTTTPDWNHGDYGQGPTNYDLASGGSNFKIDGANGLYLLDVNFSAMTYTKTLIEKIGVVGSHNGWDAGNSIAMTPSADMLTWEAVVTLTASDEFKFNMNGGWDINLGGAEDNLTAGGANLHSPGDGTYLIVLDLSTLPYQAYIEEQ